jgi:hypothetical protein
MTSISLQDREYRRTDGKNIRRMVQRSSPIAAWLVLIGALLPGGIVTLDLFGAKLTVGRVGILLLLIPAAIQLVQATRQIIVSDYFVVMTGIWMVGIAAYTGSTDSISSASAECIEYAGGYFVARGMFFGSASIASFIRALKIVCVLVVVLAIADNLSGRLITHDTLASLFNSTMMLNSDYRINIVRAVSTFDHPIMFGSFCTFSGIVFLYAETIFAKRALWVGLCFFGCLLSLSSAPMMFFMLALAAFAYNKLMIQFPWRWSVFWIVVVTILSVITLVTNHPLGWLISNLTLDPESGYFRLLIWDMALPKIAEEPWAGFAFNSLDNYILDHTVDCVWLILALRFGLPMVVLIILTNITAIFPTKHARNQPLESTQMNALRAGFTTVLVMIMLTGLTVHYWNYMWIFWGLCLGIRGSIRERSMIVYRG